MQLSSPTFTNTAVSLTGSLTFASAPTGVTVAQAFLVGTADWTFSDTASGVEFPVLAYQTIILPVALAPTSGAGQGLYVKGSGTLSICWQGSVPINPAQVWA